MKQKFLKRALAMACVTVMLAGCGGGSDTETTTKANSNNTATTSANANNTSTTEAVKQEPYKLSYMAPASASNFTEDMLQREWTLKAIDMIEEYTNTELDLQIIHSDLYYEKIPLLLAANDLPSLMVMNKDTTFVSAAQNDTFWEVTDKLDNYKNLSCVSETARMNVALNGKIYAVPRSRDVGRNGAGYRLDWVENLNLKQPETIDDLYNMLQAFTQKDPDGNGKNDTYGMIVTSYAGPWDIMQIWFGAPNVWGVRNDEITPAHLTEEWDEALAWFRKIYSEGLVNPNFDQVSSSDWDTMLRSGQGGFAVDVVDRFRRNQENMVKEQPEVEHMIVTSFLNSKGERHTSPTSGYNGIITINKSQVKTEAELDRCLDFLDKLSDAKMMDLIEGFGEENLHYYIDANGYTVRITEGVESYNTGFNQIVTYFVSDEESDRLGTRLENTDSEIRKLEAQAKIDAIPYAVPNVAAGYLSQTETDYGTDLKTILDEARINYILGNIDDVGLQAAKDQWYKAGGQKLIEEYNAIYKASK